MEWHRGGGYTGYIFSSARITNTMRKKEEILIEFVK